MIRPLADQSRHRGSCSGPSDVEGRVLKRFPCAPAALLFVLPSFSGAQAVSANCSGSNPRVCIIDGGQTVTHTDGANVYGHATGSAVRMRAVAET